MLSKEEWNSAVEFAVGESLFPESIYHGEKHWQAVASQGLKIAEMCNLGQRGKAAAALFGLFHDSRRVNDGWDPDHGCMASDAFWTWEEATSHGLPEVLVDDIRQSLVFHDDGRTTKNLIIGLGWDADRSTLDRVGITPDFSYFSCVPAENFDAFIESAHAVSRTPPSWDEIYQLAFS